MAASSVVVWEWQDEFGRWRPYSAAVSSLLEAGWQGRATWSTHPSQSKVFLGQADPALGHYVVDLVAQVQIRQMTSENPSYLQKKERKLKYLTVKFRYTIMI